MRTQHLEDKNVADRTCRLALIDGHLLPGVVQKGHYSWLAVMVPLMLLVGGYLLLMLVDIVGDRVVHVIRFYRRLENKVTVGM